MDGHGDLLADDIYCLDDGPRILDCLDFDDRLRWLDGLDDAAFLAMDLERLGATGLARQFVDWYAEFSGDPAPASLRHHYVAYRAFVRAKVACIQAARATSPRPGEARQLADLTSRHLRAGAVTLVLIGGLPGTGKSALAGAVADRLGWTVLSSDRIRKELAGMPPRASRPPRRTGPGSTPRPGRTRCYAELLHRAGRYWPRRVGDRRRVLDLGRAPRRRRYGRRGGPALSWCSCAAAPRPAWPSAGWRPVSLDRRTRTPQIARQMAAAMEPWPDATTIDTGRGGTAGADSESGPFGELVQEALGIIRPYGSGHVWRPSRPVMLPG